MRHCCDGDGGARLLERGPSEKLITSLTASEDLCCTCVCAHDGASGAFDA